MTTFRNPDACDSPPGFVHAPKQLTTQASSSASRGARPEATSRIRLLAVDRDPRNLHPAWEALSDLQLEIVEASSIQQVLSQLNTQEFAVILVTVEWPVTDAIELAALIRQRDRSGQTPILFQAAAPRMAELAALGRPEGLVDYLVTPVAPEVLRARITMFAGFDLARRRLGWEQAERERAQAEVGRLHSELARQTDGQTAMYHALEAFEYAVASDLRAPLRHIESFASMLDQSVGESLPQDKRRLLTAIRDSTARVDKLVSGLLAFARLDRTSVSRSQVRLNDLVHASVEELLPEVGERHVKWSIDSLPHVEGDSALLRQVVDDLIANALKYTGPREQARISVTAHCADDEVVVSVSDNGVGFDIKHADSLFGAFQRLHPEKQFEGTGIGLARARRIIERHGGRIWAEAVPDKGATFHFSLPRGGQGDRVPANPDRPLMRPPGVPAGNGRGAEPGRKIHVLHLEDNPTDTELVERALIASGWIGEINLVATKGAFLHALETGDYDVILSDNSVPGFDGKEALAATNRRRAGTPFLFVSGGTPSPTALARLQAAGAAGFVSKTELRSLAAAIVRVVTSQRDRY